MKHNTISTILGNIEEARRCCRDNDSVKVVAVVSGNKADRDAWQARLDEAGPHLFNSDGSTRVLSLQEKTGRKTREGNFLGTLLAYRNIKEKTLEAGLNYENLVTVIGMLFGRGERMSPVTQAEACRKPAIEVTSRDSGIRGMKGALTALEEALVYFIPVARYLEKRGFRGVINKWGDETEIASIDLTKTPEDTEMFAEYDLVKFVSVVELTDELAGHKDWVIFDKADNMIAQVSRNKKDILCGQLEALGVKPDANGKYYAGISLGPVAVSYKVLDIAADIFANEIETEGVYFDFDPFFFMALAMENDPRRWETAVLKNKDLQKLMAMIPGFFGKVQEIKKIFRKKHGRALNLKTFDLGDSVYWADIGQHSAMRKKYLSFNDRNPCGIIARKIAGIPEERDEHGNIIVDSEVSPDVIMKDSVIIGSRITGSGKIEGSVIVDSELADVDITGAFVIRSIRTARTVLAEKSGIYGSLGTGELVLGEGERHVSVLTAKGRIDMKCAEVMNMKDKQRVYNVPVLDNNISFSDAYDEMLGVSMEELEKRRAEEIKRIRGGDAAC